jgi:hypothetical protein
MSGTKGSAASKKQRSTELADANPGVDRDQMREAAKLLDGLASEGIERRGYGISSPYGRTRLRHHARAR